MGVDLGPVLTPSPASCKRTFIMSTGWMTVVAVMPARPPLTKGRAARIKGVWRKSVVALRGFSAAFDMALEASLRTASEDCFAFSRARAGGILKAEVVSEAGGDMAVSDDVFVLLCRVMCEGILSLKTEVDNRRPLK
jgi:hypothetical protein